ncbi:MAG: ferredoxin [Anaerolineae bacterium]|jgi:ferredoxin
MKIRIERDECIGCGNCTDIAPEVFELDDEGLSTVIDPNGADEDTIREAAESCPVDCIILSDDEGNQIYP